MLGVVGVPPQGIAVILGIDRILDMSRTVLNVTGDLTAAVYIARSEGVLAVPEAAAAAAAEGSGVGVVASEG